MKVSVILPAYNERDALEACLHSLFDQELDCSHEYELIVVDDGSTDGSCEMVEALESPVALRYVYLPRTAESGRSRARNTGIEMATGELLLMLDADQWMPRQLLAKHVGVHLEREDAVVLGARRHIERNINRTLKSLDTATSSRDAREYVFDALDCDLDTLAAPWQHLLTSNVSMRREHAKAVGGFDERFRGWGLEDAEFGYQLWKYGLAYIYVPEAVSYHGSRSGVTAKMHAEWRDNLVRFCAKHPAPEVDMLWLLDRVIDPSVPSALWSEVCVQIEHAIQARFAVDRRDERELI